MTATPRLFRENVKEAASERDAVLVSMDDERLFGLVFHRLGFGQAVADGLLTDYKVVVLAVHEDQVARIYQEQTAHSGELSLPDTARLVGCWNALAKRKGPGQDVSYGEDLAPMRRAVAFCKDIKTSQRVALDFPDLVSQQLVNLDNDDDSDDLKVQCRHVDGTMNAVQRGDLLDWLKEDASSPEAPVCRVLTNARCLSEGVDVPTLDAVLFLNPRRSQVDVIQAVGRVMRKAPGKELGYIVLPVAIPAGTAPEDALADNERYRVVWQVLQAIRAHDERFDASINSIEYNKKAPENIIVSFVDLSARKPRPTPGLGLGAGSSDRSEELIDDADAQLGGGGSPSSAAGSGSQGGDEGSDPLAGDREGAIPPDRGDGVQPAFILPGQVSAWKDAVYSKIVRKVGSRLYWDDWAKDIGEIAGRYISLIDVLLEDPAHDEDFEQFVAALRKTLNPSIDRAQAAEMLAQHLITKPLFDAMFVDQEFTAQNPVSEAMQGIIDRLASNAVFEKEREPLEAFYTAMVERIRLIDNLEGKQRIMLTLYDKFFSKAFPAMADRLGIVFTPVEVVDYIIRSANDALQVAFGKSLGDEGVSILEPFVGTGTFVSRLLQSNLIAPERMEHKYRHEIFANEIVLLSYYIASINIESVYRQLRLEQGHDDGYVEFPGISLTDTFQLHEADGTTFADQPGFARNSERAERQRKTPIRVILMNPPYSAGQQSANDNNQNLKYPRLDQRIADTYAARSTATLKNGLYDSYYRALRWATDKIGEEGVIAFVANNAFIDGLTADGVRLTWQEEFSDIFVFNLKGNQRTQGERSLQEGGKIFGSGARTGVAIAVLVKTRDHEGAATVHYAELGDYLSREDKLQAIERDASIAGTDFDVVEPDEHGDWINQRDDRYQSYQAIGDKATKGKDRTPAMFRTYSGGLKTNRDAWCYNFDALVIDRNIDIHIDYLNEEVERLSVLRSTLSAKELEKRIRYDVRRGSVDRINRTAIKRGRKAVRAGHIVPALYRPFVRVQCYFDPSRQLNNDTYRLPQMFPTPMHKNLAVTVEVDGRRDVSYLMVDALPDLHVMSTTQVFSLFTWHKMEEPAEGELDIFGATVDGTEDLLSGPVDFSRPVAEQIPRTVAGYERRDNITDTTLVAYRAHYQDESLTKEDIFFYVYALLHHPEYRERYAADLRKMLPHIPKCAGFWEYANLGRELAELHVNYEQVEPYPLQEKWTMGAPEDEWERFHLTKPRWTKRSVHTELHYNEYLTLTKIPEQAQRYQVGGRSPLGWVLDRYLIKQDKASGIVNDPNAYCREIGCPDYVVDLIKRLVTVSLETQRLVSLLPPYQAQA